ncbi:MAG: hypothetical protein OXC02_02395 [Rhodobacteraceae bacterium]|nr:hypothetical protein [Paracoccaceae bacterium]
MENAYLCLPAGKFDAGIAAIQVFFWTIVVVFVFIYSPKIMTESLPQSLVSSEFTPIIWAGPELGL